MLSDSTSVLLRLDLIWEKAFSLFDTYFLRSSITVSSLALSGVKLPAESRSSIENAPVSS